MIGLIRDSHPTMVDIYTKGSCLNFFLILHSIYPEAVAYFNIDHIITEIDGVFYDVNGCVSPAEVGESVGLSTSKTLTNQRFASCTEISRGNYKKYTQYYNKRRTSRSYKQMYNAFAKLNNNA